MADPRRILADVRIASPCPVLWEDMVGGDRVRHCGQCDCRVYNLSAMTAEEGVRVPRETEGRMCVQLWMRRDGTLITADCPAGRRERARRFRRRLSAIAAGVASWFAMPGCSPDAPNNYVTSPGPSPTPPVGKVPRSSQEFREANPNLGTTFQTLV